MSSLATINSASPNIRKCYNAISKYFPTPLDWNGNIFQNVVEYKFTDFENNDPNKVGRFLTTTDTKDWYMLLFEDTIFDFSELIIVRFR